MAPWSICVPRYPACPARARDEPIRISSFVIPVVFSREVTAGSGGAQAEISSHNNTIQIQPLFLFISLTMKYLFLMGKPLILTIENPLVNVNENAGY